MDLVEDPSDIFINRELSWLEFNSRVLSEVSDEQTPLLERLKFLSIFSGNLDEFFMVRVAGLKKLKKEGFDKSAPPDRCDLDQLLLDINKKCLELNNKFASYYHKYVFDPLKEENINILNFDDLSSNQKKNMNEYFFNNILPVLTPLAVDPSHPVPFLKNLSLYLVIEFQQTRLLSHADHHIGFVEIPQVLPRLIRISKRPEAKFDYLLIDSLIEANLGKLFLGLKKMHSGVIRVLRNLDYTLLENQVVDLLESIQKAVIHKVQPEAVRLDYDINIPESLVLKLRNILKIKQSDMYASKVPLHITSFMSIYQLPLGHLKEPSFNPRLPVRVVNNNSLFAEIKKKDLLIHHPYESFYTIIDFFDGAASDVNVLAIKLTLYRSSGDSPIIESLIRAAENGKHVTAVVELKARFDEKNNIVWARRLERAGVNVVYGFVGFKTHSKVALVIRREEGKIVRYCHLSTGNYNSNTAKIYTDLGLLTCRKGIGADLSMLFNLLTGFNILKRNEIKNQENYFPQFNDIVVSPISLREKFIFEIDQVIWSHKKSHNSMIMAKINGLDDKELIEKLYEASNSGVSVKLIVRGICCLRPGLEGLSENIEVISIIDRFLEHSRIFYFRSDGRENLYLGSSDWLTRNMDRRIEVIYPIFDEDLKSRIIEEILGCYWRDNVKARVLQPNGKYEKRVAQEGEEQVRSQFRLIELVREEGVKSIPYDKAIRFNEKKKGVKPIAKSKLKNYF